MMYPLIKVIHLLGLIAIQVTWVNSLEIKELFKDSIVLISKNECHLYLLFIKRYLFKKCF